MARGHDLSADDLDYCTKAVCKYILNQSVKMQYIKASDIAKHCLGGERRSIELVIDQAKETLSAKYGLSMKKIKDPKLGNIYICISEHEASSEHEYTSDQKLELKLLFTVLSYIYMRGDEVYESTLFGFLRKLGFEDDEHEYFGKYRAIITDTFPKKLYLKKEKVVTEKGDDSDCYQYSWGHRAHLEFSKERILDMVAQMLDQPKEAFPKQYEELNGENMDTSS